MDYNPNSILHFAARQSIDNNLWFIREMVKDPLTWELLIKKYEHAKRNSNSMYELSKVMIGRIIPEIVTFINERHGFIPEKQNSLLKVM